MKPPGVRLTPLYLIADGPSSVAFLASACSLATVVLRTSLLASKALTMELTETALDFTSAVVFTASVALVLASAARALAAAAASRASSIWRSRLASSSFKRSEEHTSELQSRLHLVCRLLLEKKKKKKSVLSEN